MLKHFNLKFLFKCSFVLFIISVFYGLLIRFNYAFPLAEFNYQSFLQGHSHVAFLGWGYLTTIGLILRFFVSEELRNTKSYKCILAIIVLCIISMLISFPLSGYKVVSIVLLSVFGITSYFLTFKLLKDINTKKLGGKYIKFGLYYYLLSSLATWFLAYVMVSQGKTALYYNSVYFYMHFLYNGFFVFCLLGILFYFLNKYKINHLKKFTNKGFIFLNIACIPSYFLSVLWSTNSNIYYVLGFIGAFLQLIALYYFVKLYCKFNKKLGWIKLTKLLLKIALVSFFIKIVLQLLSSFPYFVKQTLALKPYFIIGYLHLFTLGFLSILLLVFLIQSKVFNANSKTSKLGVLLVVLGILFTEVLMFLQGFLILIKIGMLSNYNVVLFCSSVLIVLGLVIFFSNQLRLKKG